MKPSKHRKKRPQSFTLIEILVVMTILGFVTTSTAIVVPGQMSKARDGRRKMDIQLVRKSLEQYYDSKKCYPESMPVCGGPFRLGADTLISSMPCDPKDESSYYYESQVGTCSPWYRLYVVLEREDDKIIDRVGCSDGCGPACMFNYGVSSPNISLEYCGITAIPTDTPVPTKEPTPSPTPTPTPSPTVIVPTNTPIPTSTLVPTHPPTPTVIPPTPTPTPTPIPQFCYQDPPSNFFLRIIWYIICWILRLLGLIV